MVTATYGANPRKRGSMSDEDTGTEDQVDDLEKPQGKSFSEEQVQNLIKDRLGRQERKFETRLDGIRAELLVDDAFKATATKEWKLPAQEEETLNDDKVQEFHEAWKERELTPVLERLEQAETKAKAMQGSQLDSELMSAGSAVAADGLLQRTADGPSRLYDMLKSDFTLDDESGEWRVKDPKRPGEFRLSGSGEREYMDVNEFIRDVWAADPLNAVFVKAETQRGSDFQGTGDSGSKKTYTRAEFAAACGSATTQAQLDTLAAADRDGRVRG